MSYHILAMTYTWWHGDDLPSLSPLPDFRCEPMVDVPLLAKLHKVEATKIEERLADANTAYLVFLEDEPVGYG
jgi:hypothetical protein